MQKNYTISLLRFIATIFIVSCHMLHYYDLELTWWLNVGVQMFFCISGYLYGNKRISEPMRFLGSNFRKILVPYYCFLLPIFVLYFLFQRNSLSLGAMAGALVTSGVLDGLGHLWFISYILVCYLLTPYLQYLADKMRKLNWYSYLLVFATLMAVAQVATELFGSYFAFHRLFCYIFGYFAAVFLQSYGEKVFKILVYILAGVTVVMNAARFYGKYILLIQSGIFDAFVAYAHAFLGVSIVLVFVVLVKGIRKNALLELSDKYSFFVYIVHQLFILSPFHLMALTDHMVLNWGITLVAILLSAVLLKQLSGVVEAGFLRLVNWVKPKLYS